jgi:hypothetical protein
MMMAYPFRCLKDLRKKHSHFVSEEEEAPFA